MHNINLANIKEIAKHLLDYYTLLRSSAWSVKNTYLSDKRCRKYSLTHVITNKQYKRLCVYQ